MSQHLERWSKGRLVQARNLKSQLPSTFAGTHFQKSAHEDCIEQIYQDTDFCEWGLAQKKNLMLSLQTVRKSSMYLLSPSLDLAEAGALASPTPTTSAFPTPANSAHAQATPSSRAAAADCAAGRRGEEGGGSCNWTSHKIVALATSFERLMRHQGIPKP